MGTRSGHEIDCSRPLPTDRIVEVVYPMPVLCLKMIQANKYLFSNPIRWCRTAVNKLPQLSILLGAFGVYTTGRR